jgi:hypothetical protein
MNDERLPLQQTMLVSCNDYFRYKYSADIYNSIMDNPPDLGSPISINRQGGFYENGKAYSFTKNWEVVVVVFLLSVMTLWKQAR